MFRFSPSPNRAHLINWREWGPGAFEEAQQQDKLVMLLIGAFWCGFCQRMDEDTLSNDETIALLNAYFIPIRVENAQRPDVDTRYNQNGWPTVAFMTPQGDHLATVNYLPPADFGNVLVRLYQIYEERKDEVRDSVARANDEIPQTATANKQIRPRVTAVAEISRVLMELADPVHGGYGPDHKFPHPEAHEFLLYRYETTGDPAYLDHVTRSLERMRSSETYDTRDGGYFRYSSKADWSEPHREKLLADHAGILQNCLRACMITGRGEYRDMAEEVLCYLDTHLASEHRGPYIGCQDYLRVTPANAEALGNGASLQYGSFASILDDWIYADANAQAASALLEASWILGRPDCKARALAILDFLWERCRAEDGAMCHYFDGAPHAPGLLIDQARMGLAFLDAYRHTGDERHIASASRIGEFILANLASPEGGFQDISRLGPAHLRFPLTLLVDNGLAASFFLGLFDATGEASHRRAALWALGAFDGDFAPYGVYAAEYGKALAAYMSSPLPVTLTARPGDPDALSLVKAARSRLGHNRLIINVRESEDGTPRAALYVGSGPDRIGPIFDPNEITSDMTASLRSA